MALLPLAACGGSTEETCKSIHWRGGQCERLAHEVWLERHGYPSSVATDY